MSTTIKKGDRVQVMAGRERGKQGVVEQSLIVESRVVITGVNLRKRHHKPSQSRAKGGIVEFAAPMARANVMIICPNCSNPTRVKHISSEDGKKFRACVHCSASLDGN